MVYWGTEGGGGYRKDKLRLDKLIRWASSAVGMKLDSLEMVAEKRTMGKLRDIMDDVSYPLHTVSRPENIKQYWNINVKYHIYF